MHWGVSAELARSVAPSPQEHHRPHEGVIAPGKRSSTHGLRGPDPDARVDVALKLARAALKEARENHLPDLREAIDARAMGKARAAADALRGALATVDRELAGAGNSKEAIDLRVEADALRLDADPVLADAPPPPPDLPDVGPWLLAYSPPPDSNVKEESDREAVWTKRLDDQRALDEPTTQPDEGKGAVGIVRGLVNPDQPQAFSSKDEAVSSIVGKADIFFQYMRDVLVDMEAALNELPPRSDSLAETLIGVAIEASLKGGLAGVAMAFVGQFGSKIRKSTADAIKTGFRELAQGAIKAGLSNGDGPGLKDDGGDFVMMDPKHVFMARHREELTYRQSEARGVVASQRDELAQLDMETLGEVDRLLGSRKVGEGFRESFSERLIVEWMNFTARWTSNTSNAHRDAKPEHLDTDLKGFVEVDIDMRRSYEPDEVTARFGVEPRLIDTMKKSKSFMKTTLGAFPVHRVYFVTVAPYSSSRISMGPSGVADIGAVTDEDLEGVRMHLHGSRVLVDNDAARKHLLEIVYEVNEKLTLEELLR